MKILVISYSYFPYLSARAFRWTNIANNWAEKGIKVDVVCAGRGDSIDKGDQEDNLNVHYVKDVTSSFKQQLNKTVDNPLEKDSSIVLNLKKNVMNIFKKTIKFFSWPDGNWFWIYPAYKKAKSLIKENKYDAVVSVALPFSSHIVALILNLGKKNITWISDFGDPFSVNDITFNNDLLYPKLNRRIEKRIIENSKKVSVTTVETIDEYVNKLKVDRGFFYVIPPLFDNYYLQLFRTLNKTSKRNEEKVKVIYTGAFHKGIREPNYILEVFSKLQRLNLSKKIELHVYGKLNECADVFDQLYNDSDWLFVHGEVSKDKLMGVYANSDVLINIGNQTTYQLPSKIIEYMFTGLPILNFISIEEDLSKKALLDYSGCKTILKENKITENFLIDISLFILKQETLTEEQVNLMIEKYSVEKISEQYLNLI